MSIGFFHPSELPVVKAPPSLLPRCGACGLLKTCQSPKMPITGEGRMGILVVAEAPGSEEDERGEQLIGPAGQELRSTLAKFDVDLDRDCWKTNALICRPPKNRTPTADEIDYCRPNLNKAIRELQPRMIIPLGAVAVKSLLAPLWREDVGSMTQWAGWRIPLQKHNCWVCPTYHPSYVIRSKDEANGEAVKVWFERHLEAAVQLEGRPWAKVPDFKSQVRIVFDSKEVARWLQKVTHEGGPVAFDYETNRLKPDHPNAEIVSCAVCWRGEETIAYPWAGAAILGTKELLLSDLPKIGANCKFEDRWTRKILGSPVRNWVWDCMLSAHHLDNRRGITSVKFQGFVRLGVEPWDTGVKQYLETEDEDGLNQIRRVDLRALLTYNAMDALVEYKVAEHQRKEMRNGSQ